MIEPSTNGGAALRLGFVSKYHWYEKQNKIPGEALMEGLLFSNQ